MPMSKAPREGVQYVQQSAEEFADGRLLTIDSMLSRDTGKFSIVIYLLS